MARYRVTYSITGTASTYVEADSDAEAREKASNYETTGETDINECEFDVWHGDITEVQS